MGAALALGVAGCGGTSMLVNPPACAPGSVLNGSRCEPFATRSVEEVPTSFVEGGRAVTLRMVVYKPLAPGPYPTMVFHHGSTGNGDDPALFSQVHVSESLARTMVARGYQVLFPQRGGRGGSGGVYDEGFEPDRSRYSCVAERALGGWHARWRTPRKFAATSWRARTWIPRGCWWPVSRAAGSWPPPMPRDIPPRIEAW